MQCTGFQNILINDLTGDFFGLPSQALPNNINENVIRNC